MDLGVIRPGDALLWGQACAEPQTLVQALVDERASLSGCRVFLGSSYSGMVRPEHADHLRFSSYCGTGTNRALAEAGVLEILPAPYSQLGALIRNGRLPCDVVMLQVSAPNARGEYSLSLGVEYLAPALEVARAVIAEVNDQVPWTQTQPLMRRDDFDAVVETSRAPVELKPGVPSELERRIAEHAAPWVPEGATLECGIGTLPNAILAALAGRRLDYHSGVICENVRLLDVKRCVGGALGGALDFIRAANQSPGGVSIIALPASRVVERLAGPVSVPRTEAGTFVTEHGTADLRGCTLAERERRMRRISGNS